jgi:hypothetical protein
MTQLCPPEHALVHEPQCCAFIDKSKQPPEPVPLDDGQHVSLPTHARPPAHEQPLAVHASPVRHMWPHEPQLLRSIVGSVHVPAQQI